MRPGWRGSRIFMPGASGAFSRYPPNDRGRAAGYVGPFGGSNAFRSGSPLVQEVLLDSSPPPGALSSMVGVGPPTFVRPLVFRTAPVLPSRRDLRVVHLGICRCPRRLHQNRTRRSPPPTHCPRRLRGTFSRHAVQATGQVHRPPLDAPRVRRPLRSVGLKHRPRRRPGT